jgi:hypothetical protein
MSGIHMSNSASKYSINTGLPQEAKLRMGLWEQLHIASSRSRSPELLVIVVRLWKNFIRVVKKSLEILDNFKM